MKLPDMQPQKCFLILSSVSDKRSLGRNVFFNSSHPKKECFNNFPAIQFSRTKNAVLKQRTGAAIHLKPNLLFLHQNPSFYGDPFLAMFSVTPEVHPLCSFAQWYPQMAYTLYIPYTCTMIEIATLVDSGFAVSSVTLWKHCLGDHVELSAGRQRCRGMYFMISL